MGQDGSCDHTIGNGLFNSIGSGSDLSQHSSRLATVAVDTRARISGLSVHLRLTSDS